MSHTRYFDMAGHKSTFSAFDTLLFGHLYTLLQNAKKKHSATQARHRTLISFVWHKDRPENGRVTRDNNQEI